MSRFRKHLGRSLLLVGGTIAALLCVEVALRVAGVYHLRRFAHDDDLGLVLIPNQQGWFCQEGCAFSRNNSAGFRDDERSLQKAPGTVRIALLGDSFVQAREVAKDERFGEILEARLNAGGFAGGRVEVLNFGVSGYGTAQELLIYRHVVSRYSPDIVLLAFFAGNDLINNVRSLERKPNKPYMVLKDGVLEVDMSFRDTPEHIVTWRRSLVHFAVDRSRLLQVAYRARERFRNATGIQAERGGVAASAGFDDIGLNQMVLVEPVVPEWKEAWEVTEAILAQMRKDVEASGARFLVVTLGMGPQVHPDKAIRERLASRLGAPDLFYPDDRIRALGERHHFPVLNLARPFQAFAEANSVYLHGFWNTKMGTGHWNQAGHDLAATLIAAELDRLSRTAWSSHSGAAADPRDEGFESDR